MSVNVTDLSMGSEIRFLPNPQCSELGNVLEIGSAWKDLMSLIPAKPWQSGDSLPEGNYNRKYVSDDINLVERECLKERRTGFEILLEEWGTSGIKRPTIFDVIILLERAQQYRAADLLKVFVNGTNNETEEQAEFPTIMLDKSLFDLSSTTHTKTFHHLADIDSGNIPHIPYANLLKSTMKFNELGIENGGTMIGNGAFGVVFKGCLSINGKQKAVAIKKFTEENERTEKQFETEIETLSRCCHKNIVLLEAFSCDGPHLCLLYEFMVNGSLQDRLACFNGTSPLLWKTRLGIVEGIAEGIVYLHTNFNPPILHRDIKSANILLDQDFIPKIGDFGIVRLGSDSTHYTTTAFGTSQYMAPEAFSGEISVKVDTFSYAIVLLEILTGLPPFDPLRKNHGLLTHVDGYEGDIMSLIDSKLENYDEDIGKALFDLAELGTEKKRMRPTMVEALSKVKSILYECE